MTKTAWVWVASLAFGSAPGFASPAPARDGAGALQADVEVEAALDRPTVRLGETVILYVRVRTKGVATPVVEEPELGVLTVVRSEDRSAFRFQIPGGATREFYREYLLRADRTGDVLIPPITVRVRGATYETKPLRLTVVAAAAPQALGAGLEPGPTDEVAVRLTVEPETVYVGQQATLTGAVFFDVGVRGQLRREPEYRAPDLQGVWATDLPTPARPDRRTIAGREFYVQVFQRAVFPLDSGIVSVPPASVLYEIRRGFMYAPQSFEARSQPARVVVRPLPSTDRPADFSGAVGRFAVDAWFDRAELRVGEAANLTFEVQGRGNLGGLIRPGVPELEGFRVYEAGESADLGVREGVWGGRKRFLWVLVPERIGRVVVPALTLTYFDPQESSYRVATTGPLVLEVKPAAALPVAEGTGSLALRSVKGARARTFPVRLWDRPLFWALQLIPPLALLFLLLRERRRARVPVPSGRRLRRSRLEGLERLRALAAEADADLFGDLRHFVLQWLEQRLGQDGLSSAGPLQLQHALEDRGVSPALAREVAEFVEMCGRHRFAPEPLPPEARGEVVVRAGELLGTVDREAVPRRRVGTRRTLAALLLPLAFGSDPFREGVRAYRDGDYEAAAKAFSAEAVRPRPDPHALYNLANTYHQLGESGRAIYLWLRAADADPRDADIRYNLRVASGDDPVLQSALPAVPITRDELALLLALLWYGAGAFGVAYLVTRSRRARWIGLGLTAASLLVIVLLARVAFREPVAVTLREGVALRAGPAIQSEALLRLPAGTALWVREERDPWVRAERPGLGEGWLPRAEAGVL